MEKKVCNKCDEIKKVTEFHKDKSRKDGYRDVCKSCIKIYTNKKYREKHPNIRITLTEDERNNRKKESIKIYYQKNKDNIKYKSKKWYENNLDKVKINKEKYKPKKRVLDKIYRENNKEKRNIKEKERKKNDPQYKLTCNIRNLIGLTFKRNGYSKSSRTYEILGCSFEEFKQHIESKWEDWMNWDNYGKYNGQTDYGWDIDHIICLATALTEEDIIKLNHFTNLQPLCGYVNRVIKRDN